MRFSVRIYTEEGLSNGATILDSSIDTLDGRPVNSLSIAKAYTDRYLKGETGCAFVDLEAKR